MRDRGYDFYWRDLHYENLFAKQFIAGDRENYELMTSFEVFEHLVEPIQEIAAMRKVACNIPFTTELPPSSIKNATQWWYFSPETRTIRKLGRRKLRGGSLLMHDFRTVTGRKI